MRNKLLAVSLLISLLNSGCISSDAQMRDILLEIKTKLVGVENNIGDIQATTNINDAEISGVKAEVAAKVETEVAVVKNQSETQYKEIGKLVENHGLPWQVTVSAYTLAAIVVCFIFWTQLKQLGHLQSLRKEK